LLLIGNKSDLPDQQVSVGEALEFAKKHNMGYLQTSAAMGTNIKESFELITKKIL
jgi:GTPase SAR1 family protein